MPMNLEYVLTSYGIWVVAFLIYIPVMKRKLKTYTQSLETHQQQKKS